MRIVLAVAAAAGAALAGAAGAAAGGGSVVWQQAGCGGCHTLAAAGATGTVGPNLDLLRPSAPTVAAQVRGGGGGMPSFAGSLSSTQIDAVAVWVSSSAGGGTTATGTASAPGARGSWVRRLQVELRRLGFFHGPMTGFYGPLTTAAVRAFQRSAGLTSDGAWGPATKAALRKAVGPSPAARAAGTLPPPAPWVARLQADLARLGFFHGPDTGVYGPLTRAAVRRFQSAAGLVVDGRWGRASQAALVRRLRG